MKKSIKYAAVGIIILLSLILIAMSCYETVSEAHMKQYLRNFSMDGLDQIVIDVATKKLEIDDADFQQEILNTLARIEPSMTTAEEFRAPGAGPMMISLIYQDGHREKLTLPTTEYSSKWGMQYFFLRIDDKDALQAFPTPSDELDWKPAA